MVILDGPNLAWRAAHAARDLETTDGRPSGVLHAGLMMLSRLPHLLEPDRLIIAWDGDSLWRKEILPEYKMNRRRTDAERAFAVQVHSQIVFFKEALRAIGVAQVRHSTLEADDWAGIIAARIPQDESLTLLSSDKDWFSLLDGRTRQIRKWKSDELDVWTADRLVREYGVGPDRWPEFLALTGDVSDNIPKVRKGIGPATARKMLEAGFTLVGEEKRTFKRNLKITRLLDKLPDGAQMQSCLTVPDMSREKRRLRAFNALIDVFELSAVRSAQRDLWSLGEWR